MTIGELERAIASKQRTEMLRAKERASYDYILADLIGRSISRIYSSSARMPEISEVYPNLFSTEEIEEKRQEQRDELSALRFKLFAEAYNNKSKEAAKVE